MLERLGFTQFAYDWRAEHLPTFEREMEALESQRRRADRRLVPGRGRRRTATPPRHAQEAQAQDPALGHAPPEPKATDQKARWKRRRRGCESWPREAEADGCTVGLYNHGGWFGEPENQIAVIAGGRAGRTSASSTTCTTATTTSTASRSC